MLILPPFPPLGVASGLEPEKGLCNHGDHDVKIKADSEQDSSHMNQIKEGRGLRCPEEKSRLIITEKID